MVILVAIFAIVSARMPRGYVIGDTDDWDCKSCKDVVHQARVGYEKRLSADDMRDSINSFCEQASSGYDDACDAVRGASDSDMANYLSTCHDDHTVCVKLGQC